MGNPIEERLRGWTNELSPVISLVEVLQDMMDGYNDTYHRSIRHTGLQSMTSTNFRCGKSCMETTNDPDVVDQSCE